MPAVTRRAAVAAPLSALLAGAETALAAPAVARAEGPGDAAPDRPLFAADLWTLPNGLRVVHVDSRRVPVVAHYLFYAAGGGEDPAGRSGVAHFLEHMMFKGSRNVAPGAFSLAVAREGGQDNAFTSRDVTAYHQTVEASRLPLVMRMEADRAGWPTLPADGIESERAVILEERRLRVDANPRGRFYEAFEAALWGEQHPLGRPLIGWEGEIRATQREDLVAFHAARYAPANAVLVVAGDVRGPALRALVDEHYAPIPVRTVPPRAERAPAPAAAVRGEAPTRVVRHDAQVREATVLRAVAAPSLTFGDAGAAWALEVLAHLLGRGQGSRLHAALVETGLATTISANHDGEVYGPGTLTLSATLRPGVAPERLEAALDAAVAALLADGPTEAECARSIRQITAGATLALDGVGAAPRMLGAALAIGLPLEAVEFWPRRLAQVTRAEVTAAARATLGATVGAQAGLLPSATGWLLPA